jgi:serine/threonine protein kinase
LLLQTSLIREATLMRKLQHPHVLQLYTSFVVGRELWLVMPYMAHGSVRNVMKKQGLTQVGCSLAGTLSFGAW